MTLLAREWAGRLLQARRPDAQGGGEVPHAADADMQAGLAAHDRFSAHFRLAGEVFLGESSLQANRSETRNEHHGEGGGREGRQYR